MRGSRIIHIMLCTVLMFSFVVAAPPGEAEAGGAGWHWLNPLDTGDSLNAVSMSPASGSSCMWAVGNYGFIAKTFDYGNSWHKFWVSGLGTKTLNDVDLFADSVGWAVGEGGTIVKISEGWNTTLQTAPAGTNDLYAVDVVDATHAWAVGYNGDIIKTVDGVTWTMVSDDPFPNIIFKAAQFTPSGYGWVGGLGDGTGKNIFYVGTDGLLYDKSTADTTFAVEELVVDIAANTIIAVGQNGSSQPLCYRATSPNVLTATESDVFYGNLPTGLGVTGALTGIAYVDSTHWWVSTSAGEILLYGTSFTKLASPFPNGSFNDIDFRVNPGVEYRGVVVGSGGILASTGDGGNTWSTRPGVTENRVAGLDFVSLTTGYATSGSDIIKSTDSGKTWDVLGDTGSLALLDVDFKADGTGWAVGRSGSAYFFGGTAWTPITGISPGRDLYSVCYLDSTNIWACGGNGTIANSTGTSWTMSPDTDVTSGLWRSIDFFDASHGIAVGDNGAVVYTTNGTDWNVPATTPGSTENIYSVDMVSESVGYAVGGDGGASVPLMWKTTNGGIDWTQITGYPATYTALRGVSFADANNGWIVGANGAIWHTTTGGTSWPKENISAEWLHSVSAVSSTAAWAGGDYGALLTNYTPPAPPTKTTVYRFFNMKNGTHLYTADYAEKLKIIASWPDIYRYEGTGYVYAAYKASQPLHRFFNMKNGSHFYTATEEEKAKVIANWSSIYKYEGPAYNISNTPLAGATTVWRFFRYDTGSHFYTADPAERDRVKANWPTIYRYEGEAYWLPQ